MSESGLAAVVRLSNGDMRTHNNDMYVVSDSPKFINSLDKTFVQSYHGGHTFSPAVNSYGFTAADNKRSSISLHRKSRGWESLIEKV